MRFVFTFTYKIPNSNMLNHGVLRSIESNLLCFQQPRNSGQAVSKIPVADQPPDVIKYEPYEPHSAAADVRKRTQSPTVPMSAGISPDDFQSPTHEFEVIEEIYDLVINRQSGQGLGVSIAGGKGSPPYKGNDEVEFAKLLGSFSNLAINLIVVQFFCAIPCLRAILII